MIGEEKAKQDYLEFITAPDHDVEVIPRVSYAVPEGAKVDAGFMLLGDCEDAPETYQGLSVVAIGDKAGSSGLGWNNGYLYVEHHPKLRLWGRGTSALSSEYWKLRLAPQFQQVVQILFNVICSAPWRLEEPELPEWLEGNEEAEAIRRKHWAWASVMWSRWTSPGSTYQVRHALEQILYYSLGFGAYIGEGWLERGVPVPGYGALDLPVLPRLRAPWSIRESVFDGDCLLGFVQESNDSDAFGKATPSRVFLPIGQCMHVVHRPAGPTDTEGQSLMRPAYTLLRMILKLYQSQGLSVECDSTGTWVYKQHLERAFTNTPGSADGEMQKIAVHHKNYTSTQMPWAVVPQGGELDKLTNLVADLTPQLRLLEMQALMAMGGAHHLVAAYGDGSRAAKVESERTARDQIDYYAKMCADGLAQYIEKMIALAFPEDVKAGHCYPPGVTYAQIEERDNLTYIQTIKEYMELRPLLTPDDQSKIDEMLDLATPVEAEDEGQDLTMTPTDKILQARLAYSSGVFHDRDLGPWVRSILGSPEISDEGRREFFERSGKVGGEEEKAEQAVDSGEGDQGVEGE